MLEHEQGDFMENVIKNAELVVSSGKLTLHKLGHLLGDVELVVG